MVYSAETGLAAVKARPGPHIQPRPETAPGAPTVGAGGAGLAAFIAKLRNWTPVARQDVAALRRMQTSTSVSLPRIRRRLTREVCILNAGVAYRYWLAPGGERGISEIFYPGDVVNFDALDFGESCCELAARHASFTTLRRDAVGLLRDRPALDCVITRAEVARAYFLTDRFCAAMRLRADARVLRVLLEMKAHEELADRGSDHAVSMPFTQRELGDMTGLTPVYVSKTLSRLERDGHITRRGRHICFRDRQNAQTLSHFTNYFARLHPPAASRSAAEPSPIRKAHALRRVV